MSVIKANKRLGVVKTPAEQMSISAVGFFFPSVSGRYFLLVSVVPKSLQGCALIMYRYSASGIVTVSNVCVCFGWISEHTLHLPSLVTKTET